MTVAVLIDIVEARMTELVAPNSAKGFTTGSRRMPSPNSAGCSYVCDAGDDSAKWRIITVLAWEECEVLQLVWETTVFVIELCIPLLPLVSNREAIGKTQEAASTRVGILGKSALFLALSIGLIVGCGQLTSWFAIGRKLQTIGRIHPLAQAHELSAVANVCTKRYATGELTCHFRY